MGKAKSFADKVKKGTHDFTTHCPKCGESFTSIKLIASEMSDKSKAWRFRQHFVRLCKCNENEIIG